MSFTVDDGRIVAIDVQRNPEKLRTAAMKGLLRVTLACLGGLGVGHRRAGDRGAALLLHRLSRRARLGGAAAALQRAPRRDVGGFYLAFGLLFAWAAVTLARSLIVPLCVTWSVAAPLHGVFHALHLDGMSAGDAIAEIGGLAAVLVLPFLAIWVVRRDVTDLAV